MRRLAIGGFTALVALPLVGAAVLGTSGFRPAGPVLEIEMQASGGTKAELFWASESTFSAEHSSTLPLHQGPDPFERLRFPLPDVSLWMIRFDPLDGPGEVLIRRVRVLDREDRTVRVIDPILLEPMNEIERIAPAASGDLRIATTAGATDPMLSFRGVWLSAPAPWYSLWLVTPLSLAWVSVASAALLLTAAALVARDVGRGAFRLRDALWFGGLAASVLAAKFALIARYPAPVPYWDQWIGEATGLYLPYANGGLTWAQMFHLHNEHRIFFTRVLALALLVLNGQWDPQLQMVVNAVLHVSAGVVFAVILWLAAGRRLLPLFVLVIGLTFAPPFGVENTIGGFQSAFYFLVLFSGLAFWLMIAHSPGTPAWLVGWLCASCALFTLAGGVLTVTAIGGVVVLECLSPPRPWRATAITLAALVAVVAVGYATRSPPLPGHQFMTAANWTDFRIALARNLAFPWIPRQRLAPVVWAPVGALTVLVASRRFASTRLERVALALGAWVAVQAAVLAYSRGVGGGWPASRYLDMLCFAFIANTAALVAILLSCRTATARRLLGGTIVIWLAAGSAGIVEISRLYVASDGVQRRTWMRESVRNVRQFVVTGDARTLAGKHGPMEIPFYDANMLMAWLSHPVIRRMLPASVRAPLTLAASAKASGFEPTPSSVDGLPVWNSGLGGRVPGEGRFESDPVACREFGRVRVEVGGAVAGPATRLFLKSVPSGAETPIDDGIEIRPGWGAVTVRCPAGPFSVVGIDESPTVGFAFSQPTEIAWASSAAESAIHRSRLFGAIGLMALLLAAGSSTASPRDPADVERSAGH